MKIVYTSKISGLDVLSRKFFQNLRINANFFQIFSENERNKKHSPQFTIINSVLIIKTESNISIDKITDQSR